VCGTAYHRKAEARTGLAKPVVIDENRARLRPRGKDAVRWQLGANDTIGVRRVTRRRKGNGCLGLRLVGYSEPLFGFGPSLILERLKPSKS